MTAPGRKGYDIRTGTAPNTPPEVDSMDATSDNPRDGREISTIDLDDPSLFLNREINWIDFDAKVLEEAEDEETPLLERLKFLCIFWNNLDEFFMVRVANIFHQHTTGFLNLPPDGMTPARQLATIRKKLLPLISKAQNRWLGDLLPALRKADIRITPLEELGEKQKKFLEGYFRNEIYPILTPQAIDPGRPFPTISNLSLNFLVELLDPDSGIRYARLKIPKNFSRFVFIPRNKEAKSYSSFGISKNTRSCDIVLIEDMIRTFLPLLFPGYRVLDAATFRITRNTDVEIEEDEASDLLEAVRNLVDRRNFGEIIRLEASKDMSRDMLTFLIRRFHLAPFQVYRMRAPLAFQGYMTLCDTERPDLKDEPFSPRMPAPFRDGAHIFAGIRAGDALVYHPYDSFIPVLDFVRRAATDPKVVAIKITLYRVGSESPIVQALIEARRNGKQVTALVELKARFDEERNITWAEALEEAGVHVVYGLVGYKIHAKMCLVVRRETDGIRRYVHIGTGNYNPVTAQIYGDLGLFTADPAICADITDLFNAITGYSRKDDYRRILVSPMTTRAGIIGRIEREVARHRAHGDGEILFKMNQLVDKACIQALYRASMAGVRIRLQVRGICCLRPGVPGVSETIEVTSVVGRFLEHVRIFFFHNGGDEELLIGSADLMPRNLDRRIEILVPVRDAEIRRTIRDDILRIHLADTAKARCLREDGTYVRVRSGNGEPVVDSQRIMMNRTSGYTPVRGEEEKRHEQLRF